jgi:1-deoxy-D-xylulose-5-phosphate synthase
MYTAQLGLQKPIAIRYPRGKGRLEHWKRPMVKMEIGTSFELKKGNKIALLSTGPVGNMITDIIEEFDSKDMIGHYNFPFVKPLDQKRLAHLLASYEHIITIEDGSSIGGFGSAVVEFANENDITKNIKIFGVPDEFIPHGTVEELYKLAGIDKETIKEYLAHIT